MTTVPHKSIQKDNEKNPTDSPAFAGKINIVPPCYARRTILLNIFRRYGFVIFLCATGIGTYIWQHQAGANNLRDYQATLLNNDIEFETAFNKTSAYYDAKIQRLQKRIDDLGNQNTVLRKQRDEARSDLTTIIKKKNQLIQELRIITDGVQTSESERAQARMFLKALEKKYFSEDVEYKESLEAIYRLEFLRDTFPDFEKIRD